MEVNYQLEAMSLARCIAKATSAFVRIGGDLDQALDGLPGSSIMMADMLCVLATCNVVLSEFEHRIGHDKCAEEGLALAQQMVGMIADYLKIPHQDAINRVQDTISSFFRMPSA